MFRLRPIDVDCAGFRLDWFVLADMLDEGAFIDTVLETDDLLVSPSPLLKLCCIVVFQWLYRPRNKVHCKPQQRAFPTDLHALSR